MAIWYLLDTKTTMHVSIEYTMNSSDWLFDWIFLLYIHILYIVQTIHMRHTYIRNDFKGTTSLFFAFPCVKWYILVQHWYPVPIFQALHQYQAWFIFNIMNSTIFSGLRIRIRFIWPTGSGSAICNINIFFYRKCNFE